MFESLKKWNPFKFKRGEKQEKSDADNARTSSSATENDALAPMSPEHLSPSFGLDLMNHPMWRWQKHMDRMFDQFLKRAWSHDPFYALSHKEDWFGDFSPARFQPNIDVLDNGTHLVVTAELPGMSADDVEVTLQDNMLIIQGEKRIETQHEEEGCYRTERAYGAFKRAIPLPKDIAQDDNEATFENGLLTIRLRKLDSAKDEEQVKQIPIK